MGIGDEIMASGHALTVHRQTLKKVRIVGKNGLPRSHELWDMLPWIVQKGEKPVDFVDVVNGPQARPYIAYPFNRRIGCRYTSWRARDNVGDIFIPDDVKRYVEPLLPAREFMILEPHVPAQSNPNKQWGWERWQKLASLLLSINVPVCQVGPPGTRTLDGVRLIETPSFIHGVATMIHARISVLPEGGLHHAAGAKRLPAVVLFGGAVNVENTGYPWHRNIVDTKPGSPCGKWLPCEHCKSVWENLTPEKVLSVVLGQ